jgi:O-acetylhomoserine/O-acetylserine sulfhydrylase-like pyridoxal-dependent enzyme
LHTGCFADFKEENLTEMHFETKALHTGYDYAEGGNIFPPIDMGVAFPFPSGEQAQRICTGQESGYVYARTRNRTNTVFEKRLAAMESGQACLGTSSGLAAIFIAVLGLLEEPGANFVTSSRLYGNTQNQFRKTLPLINITARWVETPEVLDAWQALINDKTKFLFFESPSNPDVFVADLVGLIDLAKGHGIKVMVDTTLATPAVIRPLEMGADVVIHSTTKYLAGHSAALGGAIIGSTDFIEGLRSSHHHYLGPTMSAFTAWLTLIGMETLGVRMPRMISNAQKVAEFLANHPKVESVNYPGLPSHPQHELALEQMGSGGTSLLAFEVEGGKQAAWSVLERLKIACHATHLGGNQTVAVHPATTTHGKLTPEERAASGVPDGLIRYCVGLEDPNDLIADLDQALS